MLLFTQRIDLKRLTRLSKWTGRPRYSWFELLDMLFQCEGLMNMYHSKSLRTKVYYEIVLNQQKVHQVMCSLVPTTPTITECLIPIAMPKQAITRVYPQQLIMSFHAD